MGMRMHDWMDNWFLSLAENPDKLDEAIKNYEKTRIIFLISFVIVLVMTLLTVFKSVNSADYGFMFSLFVLSLVMNLQVDIFTKILKLQRRNLKNDGLPNN